MIWNKKQSSKQVVSMVYTLRKVAVATFKGLQTFLFTQSNKVYSTPWSVIVFFAFLGKKDEKDTGCVIKI